MKKDSLIYVAGHRGLGWAPKVGLEEGIRRAFEAAGESLEGDSR